MPGASAPQEQSEEEKALQRKEERRKTAKSLKSWLESYDFGRRKNDMTVEEAIATLGGSAESSRELSAEEAGRLRGLTEQPSPSDETPDTFARAMEGAAGRGDDQGHMSRRFETMKSYLLTYRDKNAKLMDVIEQWEAAN